MFPFGLDELISHFRAYDDGANAFPPAPPLDRTGTGAALPGAAQWGTLCTFPEGSIGRYQTARPRPLQ